MNIENPYVKEYQELLRKYDELKTPELKAKLEQIKAKSEDFVKNLLSELDGKLNTIIGQKNRVEIEVKKSDVNLRQEYKKAIVLYREASDIVVELRNLKKNMRDMIDQKVKNKQEKGIFDF